MEIDIGAFLENHRKELSLAFATILATALLIVGLELFTRSTGRLNTGKYVPDTFIEARNRAAGSADKIVNLTAESASNIEAIRNAEKNGNYSLGLSLIGEETKRNGDVRETAVELSEELSDMAKLSKDISPTAASEVGLQAVAKGIELVQRLVSYSNNTQELLAALQDRLGGNNGEETRVKIESLTSTVNEDIRVINSLSGGYRELMAQFDALTS